MAKKKDLTAADDLIKSLLDEVNEENTGSPASDFSATNDKPYPSFEGPSDDDPSVFNLDEALTHSKPGNVVMSPNPDPKAIAKAMKSDIDAATQPAIKLAPEKPAPAVTSIGSKTGSRGTGRTDDKTMALPSLQISDTELRRLHAAPPEKVMVNANLSGVEATLAQAENLRIAQQRILELEQEVDRLRQDNDEVSSAAQIVKSRLEELASKNRELEVERDEVIQDKKSETLILRSQLEYKESELAKAIQKIEDLEIRLKNDFRKVRVRERELENRLELVKAEKTALIRSKDESILELKRKVDQLEHEIDNYREKCLELNKTLDSHKEQFKRTVRALKLALTNLEVKEEEVIPLKKAE